MHFINCIQTSSQPGLLSDKMSAKAEMTNVKKKKKKEEVEENAMDEVQPINSISNVTPN